MGVWFGGGQATRRGWCNIIYGPRQVTSDTTSAADYDQLGESDSEYFR